MSPAPSRPARAELYEVVIVGGGPAGLSAALLLGRCRRRTLVLDTGKPRNAASPAMHGFLSREGFPPREFLQVCRAQLAPFDTVEQRARGAIGARREGRDFVVELNGGSRVRARRLLLCTGLCDELPDFPGVQECFGITLHHCPYCDGWEQRDQALAVLGGTVEGAQLALTLRNWSDDIVLCTNGGPILPDGLQRDLALAGISLREERIAALEAVGASLQGIRFVDGSTLPRQAAFFSPGQYQKSSLAHALGCDFDPVGGIVTEMENARTCVPGVYAAGNASRGLQLVIVAAAEGALAAHAIQEDLAAAELEAWRSDGRVLEPRRGVTASARGAPRIPTV